MKKLRYIALTLLSALTLTSCSLFSDADIEIKNKFNPKGNSSAIVTTSDHIGDVYGAKCSDVPNTTVFKNVVYSNMSDNKIENTYKTLPEPFNVNSGNDYVANKDKNNFDLYVPDILDKSIERNIVLFIHGGAWISGLKTQVNPYVKRFAKEGYIAATIEYTLLSKEMDDASLSIFRNLDEIDACIKTIKEGLEGLGFTGTLNLVLGGASSGAHLAMLYAYSRKASCPMPIKFLIDAVGPTDIDPNVWKAFSYSSTEEHAAQLNAGIDSDAIDDRKDEGKLADLEVAGQGYYWNQYQTMRIANGMAGLPFSVAAVRNETSDETLVDDDTTYIYKSLVSNSDSAEKRLSVTYHLAKTDKIPIICAYAGEDSVVGIAQYANLQKAMVAKLYIEHTDYEFIYFKNCGHVDLDKDETAYTSFVNKILEWIETK